MALDKGGVVKIPRERLVDDALCAQKSIFVAMQANETVAWIQLELTMAQIKGLFLLADHGPVTVGRLADLLGIGKPSASILADRLVQLGMVDRTDDSNDRRRTFIGLSPQGENLVVTLRQGGRELLFSWLGRLSDDDLAALAQGLRALAAIATSD